MTIKPSCKWYNLSNHMVQNTNQAPDSMDKKKLAQVHIYYLTGSRSMFFLINIFSPDDRNSIKPTVGLTELTLAVGLTSSTVPALTIDGSRTHQGIASAAQAESVPKRPPPQAVRQYYSMTLNPICKWYNLSNHMVHNTNQACDSMDKRKLAQVHIYYLTGSRSMFFLINIFSPDDRNSIKPTVELPELTLAVGLT